MQYAVIAENDESQWDDQTGIVYHFPRRYASMLLPGAKLIYYKGKMRRPEFAASRLSSDPHYFGIATAGRAYPDKSSDKGDLFIVIANYHRFDTPVPIQKNGTYFEHIPEHRKTNYWRDGVRMIDRDTYERILATTSLTQTPPQETSMREGLLNDVDQALTSGIEGQKQVKYSTTYERDPKLRKQAVLIHGTSCAACGFNFEKVYGEPGKGYIHIHHLKPVSTMGGPQAVNPETDLVPVCANCHTIIHRQKGKTLTIDELKDLLSKRN